MGAGDRLTRSKQTAAMAAAICGPKVSKAQCFRGFAAETWRVAAHRQWRRWAFGGGRIRAEWPKLLWAGGGRKLATGALSGRIWRKLQRGAAGRGALLAGSAELLLGESPGGPGRAGFSAVNRSGVREAASRTGRKNSAGAGVLGVRAHFRRKGRSCCWLAAAGGGAGGGGAEGGGVELAELAELLRAGRKAGGGAALSKNCSKGWFRLEALFFAERLELLLVKATCGV